MTAKAGTTLGTSGPRKAYTKGVASLSLPRVSLLPQSIANVAVHLVFSTKDRQPFLIDDGLRTETHNQLGGASKTLGCSPLIVGGVEDHVHLLARMSRTIAISDWVKELKRVTSIWIKGRDRALGDFQWQAGYGAFSVSQSEITRVSAYIANQTEHHRERDFKEKFRLLLERHRIGFDERYVCD